MKFLNVSFVCRYMFYRSYMTQLVLENQQHYIIHKSSLSASFKEHSEFYQPVSLINYLGEWPQQYCASQKRAAYTLYDHSHLLPSYHLTTRILDVIWCYVTTLKTMSNNIHLFRNTIEKSCNNVSNYGPRTDFPK